MFVWTEKAEQDYLKKFPGRRPKRKAGKEAMYDDKPVELQYEVTRAFKARGWLKEISKESSHKLTDDEIIESCTGVPVSQVIPEDIRSGGVTHEEKVRRWVAIKKACRLGGSLSDIAVRVGYHSRRGLTQFMRNYGPSLAKDYGKLPYIQSLMTHGDKKFWSQVVETR